MQNISIPEMIQIIPAPKRMLSIPMITRGAFLFAQSITITLITPIKGMKAAGSRMRESKRVIKAKVNTGDHLLLTLLAAWRRIASWRSASLCALALCISWR